MEEEDQEMWVFEEPFVEAEGKNKGIMKEEEAEDCLDHHSEDKCDLLILCEIDYLSIF